MKKAVVFTLGCKVNGCESGSLARGLSERGWEVSDELVPADLYILNTCAVTGEAEKKSRQAIARIAAVSPEAPVIVCGCAAEKAPAAFADKRSVTLVTGARQKGKILELIDGFARGEGLPLAAAPVSCGAQTIPASGAAEKVRIDEADKEYDELPAPVQLKTRAFVKIQDGCNNFCSYCIVPYVRGRERSRRPENIIAEVNGLLDQGYREITLLGQNVNSYGNDAGGGFTFPQLLRDICKRKEKFRLRFMTSNPKDFGEELVRAIADCEQICNLVHLPVQAGSDRILRLMNRKYTAEEYLKKVELIRKYVPDCCLTSDVMVGFPTETEEDFRATLDLVREAKFSTAFTFVYSPRSGTKAAGMDGQIPDEVKKDRIMRLVELVNSQTREMSAGYLGKTIEILCEDFDEKKGLYLGRDEYGRMGYFKSDARPIGKFVRLKITDASGVSLYGEECGRA